MCLKTYLKLHVDDQLFIPKRIFVKQNSILSMRMEVFQRHRQTIFRLKMPLLLWEFLKHKQLQFAYWVRQQQKYMSNAGTHRLDPCKASWCSQSIFSTWYVRNRTTRRGKIILLTIKYSQTGNDDVFFLCRGNFQIYFLYSNSWLDVHGFVKPLRILCIWQEILRH